MTTIDIFYYPFLICSLAGVGIDLSQSLAAPSHQVPSCGPSDPGPSSDRSTMGLLDKTSSVAAMMEALAEARNMRQPSQPALPHPHPYPIHLSAAASATVSSDNTQASSAPQPIFPRTATNMTMHYVHPNMTAMGGGAPGGVQASHYHHLTALTGETATRTSIASHPQPIPTHNPAIPPTLIGMGQGQTPPPPLGHFPNMMHF